MKLAFLWHQHQPYYKDLRTGEYLLPWVRLHCVKDYLDMVEILTQFPRIRQTFNMVPSLLEQIADYARGAVSDTYLNLSLKNAAELSDKDKSSLLDLFFQANYDNMIVPYRRYNQLYKGRRSAGSWEEAEWRDLQTLFNLAWIDPSFRKSGRLAELSRKGERFTEDEKIEILDIQKRIISDIIPRMREAADRGQIEISTTPYFHPIMPLLYDTDIAATAIPGIALPKERFRHPEDVDRQIALAVELHSNLFGRPPNGVWPSEGSVSEDIIPIVRKYGIRWMATDEEILANSLSVPCRGESPVSLISSGNLYRCYRFGGAAGEIRFFFRDHGLSDNIGFVYSRWDPEKAADDFVGKLKAIGSNLKLKNIDNPIISVILDGENAWEYYKNDGRDFLEALYTKISNADWVETTTFSQYLDTNPGFAELDKIYPGSWINHNFAIWIGHSEDNKAWDLLFKARKDLVDFEKANPGFNPDKLKFAWREIYIAEGSDWCWWFGDDHVGPNNDDFDRLFRSHLANVYYLTDREPPPEFFSPIRSGFSMDYLTKPSDYISPKIDGILTHYYEWHQAGYYDCSKAGSTMHKAENIVSGIWFGFDPKNIYIRIDRAREIDQAKFRSLTFEIEFLSPVEQSLYIRATANEPGTELTFSLKDILEIAIPLTFFRDLSDGKVIFRIVVKEDEKALEFWPATEALKIELPMAGSPQIPWVI